MADPKNLESDPQWQEVKKVIRSVLLTNVKNGLTLNVMKQRYKELWQAPLDFKQFGFSGVLEMVKAMPDAVRLETMVTGNEVKLHARVDDNSTTYLTPALKRAVNRKTEQLALSSDSESDIVPRKKVHSSSSIPRSDFKVSDRKPLLSSGKFHQYQQKVFKSNPKVEPVATQSFPQLIKQEEENDPVRKEIANQMKPNTRGYYAVLVPRNRTGITSTEVVEEVFRPFGDLKDVSRTERYYFIRYQYRQQAVSAVLATRGKYGTGVPEEKGNPQRLIKAKDIVNKPTCSRQMATKSNMSLLSASNIKEENLEDVEVFIGNINVRSTEADVLRLFENYEVKKKRFVCKDKKRFAFFTVVGLDEAKKMCSDVHRTKLDGRELVVQVSYVSTNESMPAIEPAVPEEDMHKFTKEAPQGTYKQLTNLDFESDGSDNEQDCLPYPARKFPETDIFKSRPSLTSDNTWSSGLIVNTPALPSLVNTDDLHPLEDIRKVVEVEAEGERTVVYSGPDCLDDTSTLESDSEVECNVSFNPGARELHVILEGFPHHTHYKQIYKEFRKIGIERLKVDVVSNYPPDPTLAIVTFDCDEAVEEALKWDGKDFNHQPMFIRRLNTNNKFDMDMLKVVLNDGKRNEEFNDKVRHQMYGERTVHVSNNPQVRGVSHKPCRGIHRGGQRGRGQYMYMQNVNEYGYQHHMGQGDFLHPPFPPVGYRGAVHPVPQPISRPFIGRGGVGFKPPAPHHNRPPFRVTGASTSPRFRGTNPLSGHRPPHRGMGYTRGRGSFTTKQNHHSNQSKQSIDPFAPTSEDYDVSSQLQQMLDDCFPEGCKPWIAKDLPAKIEAHIAEIINERYFFAHVTNGLPGIEIKEMTRKMGDKAFIDGAEPYTDPTIRRCAALYSDNPEEQPPELFRAWIKDLSEDGQCEVFFIDWGNISKQSRDNLSVIKDIHWTMRPQIVLFRMNDTSSLPRNMKVTLKVLTESVYEKNYVVPVELTEE